MKGRRNTFVATEGIPFIAIMAILVALALNYASVWVALAPMLALVLLILVFRDPPRVVPAIPLGVIGPVDGVVADVGLTDKSVLGGEAHKIIVRVNSLGAYTARCPAEGKVVEFDEDTRKGLRGPGTTGLWVRTDEGDDVVLQFFGHRFGIAPLALSGFGERVGQGQRCAYLRLTRFAEVQLPINGRVLIAPGEQVVAGETVLAKLPHP